MLVKIVNQNTHSSEINTRDAIHSNILSNCEISGNHNVVMGDLSLLKLQRSSECASLNAGEDKPSVYRDGRRRYDSQSSSSEVSVRDTEV